MFLELDEEELKALADDPAELKSKVTEAVRVLDDFESQTDAAENTAPESPADAKGVEDALAALSSGKNAPVAVSDTSAAAEKAAAEEHSRNLGHLTNLVQRFYPSRGEAVMRLFTQLSSEDMLVLLNDPAQLHEKVQEALTLLDEYEKREQMRYQVSMEQEKLNLHQQLHIERQKVQVMQMQMAQAMQQQQYQQQQQQQQQAQYGAKPQPGAHIPIPVPGSAAAAPGPASGSSADAPVWAGNPRNAEEALQMKGTLLLGLIRGIPTVQKIAQAEKITGMLLEMDADDVDELIKVSLFALNSLLALKLTPPSPRRPSSLRLPRQLQSLQQQQQ
jgi:hypothetical protein